MAAIVSSTEQGACAVALPESDSGQRQACQITINTVQHHLGPLNSHGYLHITRSRSHSHCLYGRAQYKSPLAGLSMS